MPAAIVSLAFMVNVFSSQQEFESTNYVHVGARRGPAFGLEN
jgi:hypothetical protein